MIPLCKVCSVNVSAYLILAKTWRRINAALRHLSKNPSPGLNGFSDQNSNRLFSDSLVAPRKDHIAFCKRLEAICSRDFVSHSRLAHTSSASESSWLTEANLVNYEYFVCYYLPTKKQSQDWSTLSFFCLTLFWAKIFHVVGELGLSKQKSLNSKQIKTELNI